MVEFSLDDDDRGPLAILYVNVSITDNLLGSNASSDNDQDELMEDADEMEVNNIGADADADDDGDGDENEDENGDDDQERGEDEDEFAEQSQSQPRRPSLPTTNTSSDEIPITTQINGGPTSHPHPTLTLTSASPRQVSAPPRSPKLRFEVRPEALTASTYDIVPTMAAPQSTSINAIAATPDMRYWFTGGSDCYIRKYDGVATVNGKTLLTVAQRHPFVDSVVKAGVLMSYWDNEETAVRSPAEDQTLSPVYSLAVQSQALWMLSGLESGAINLYSVRHDEGKLIACLQKHKSAVSVLTLDRDEKSVLSGSWDKNVYDWDLNTGQVKRAFEGSGGQISAIEIRPASSLPVPEESGEPAPTNGTFSSNNGEKPRQNSGIASWGTGATNGHKVEAGSEDAPNSPTDSLFGDDNSLFGDATGDGAPSGGNFADDDDEFSRAMNAEIDNQALDGHGDLAMKDVDTTAADASNGAIPAEAASQPNGEQDASSAHTNGILQGETSAEPQVPAVTETQDAVATSDSTFLAASIDGTLRIWDRRQPNPIARIPTRSGVPPWCMAACWSPDGNFIYAGRRNGTVEEFSLHKGLKTAERTFKFPQGSGAVSAVRAMPNGRHLIWYVSCMLRLIELTKHSASHDILRLYDLKESAASKHSTVPFLIVPGPPRAGVISTLHIDPTCKYMLSTAGNRGWEGSSTEVLIGYEIGIPS
jgi:transcriptional activator SPT8